MSSKLSRSLPRPFSPDALLIMRAHCSLSIIRSAYPHCATGERISGGKNGPRRPTAMRSCKELAGSRAVPVALERRRRDARLEFPLAALLEKIVRELRQAGGIIDPAGPDTFGAAT